MVILLTFKLLFCFDNKMRNKKTPGRKSLLQTVDSSTDSRAPDDAGAPPIAQPDNEWTQQSVIEKATSSSPPRAALNAANVAKHNQQIELVSRGVLCYPHLSTLITYSLFGLNVLHISAAPTPPPLNPPR